MKWKHVDTWNNGRKTVNRFAIFPTTLEDGYDVWLEWYKADLHWEFSMYGGFWVEDRCYQSPA